MFQQGGAPLIAGMAVNMDDYGGREILANPGETKINTIKLEYRSARCLFNQIRDKLFHTGIIEFFTHI